MACLIGLNHLAVRVAAAPAADSPAAGALGAENGSGSTAAKRSPLFLQVGLISMEGVAWDTEGNFRRLEAYTREAAARRAQLVIAPELILDGDVCDVDPEVTKERMMKIAQVVPTGPYLMRAANLCRELGIYLIFGFTEKAGDDLFNTCALFNPEGEIIAKYRKVHPEGNSFITPGQELKTFETPFGRVGLLICSDRGVVDNFSTLGAQGAEIILLPMDGGGGPPNTTVLRQRARDNKCCIVVANTWSSVILNWHGESMLERYETECVSVGRVYLYDLPKGAARGQFLERRPDLYEPLTAPPPDGSLFDEKGRPTRREEKIRADSREMHRQAEAGASGKVPGK